MRPEGASKGALGGDHVEGRQAVRELLLAGSRRVREVILETDLDTAPIIDDIIDLADEQKVHIRELSRSNFENEALTQSSQGVIARAAPLTEYSLEQLARPIDGPDGTTTPPFLLALDSVTDPGNLGAMLRTAECAGVTGVLLPRHRAARLTPTATKAAAGAIEHIPMAVVSGIAGALSKLSELGVWSVGLDGAAEHPLWDMNLADQPVVLVLGAEGTGLSRLVAERCDALVQIPLAGALGSLNVASAAAVAMYEVVRLRGQ